MSDSRLGRVLRMSFKPLKCQKKINALNNSASYCQFQLFSLSNPAHTALKCSSLHQSIFFTVQIQECNLVTVHSCTDVDQNSHLISGKIEILGNSCFKIFGWFFFNISKIPVQIQKPSKYQYSVDVVAQKHTGKFSQTQSKVQLSRDNFGKQKVLESAFSELSEGLKSKYSPPLTTRIVSMKFWFQLKSLILNYGEVGMYGNI